MFSCDVKFAEQRNLLFAIALTSLIMALEFAGGIISNSLALLSDAWHMFADLMSLILCYIAGHISIRSPTSDKTYGYYRVEILAAFINGATLVIVASFIFYEAFGRLLSTVEVQSTQMLLIAVLGLLTNLISMMIMSRKMLSLNVKAAFLHIFSDAITSIGVIIAAIAIYFTGLFIIDAIIGIIIGIVIIYGSSSILRSVIHILLEGVPPHIEPKKVIYKLKNIEGVIDVHDLHIWSITSYVHLLSAHVVLDNNAIRNVNNFLNQAKIILKDDFDISHSTLQLEREGYQEIGHICSI